MASLFSRPFRSTPTPAPEPEVEVEVVESYLPEFADAIAGLIDAWETELQAGLDVNQSEVVLHLEGANPNAHAQLFAGRPTRLSNLLREADALAEAQRVVRTIRRVISRARANNAIAPLHLAIGTARWQSEAGSESAPLLLCPVKLTGATDDTVAFTMESSVMMSPAFVRALRQRGVQVDATSLVNRSLTPRGFSPQAALDYLHDIGRNTLPGYTKQDTLTLGLIVRPGEDILAAFQTARPELESSVLVAALAGDVGARDTLTVTLAPSVAHDRDPGTERGAGDLDPDQLDIIDAVAAGHCLAIDAPPGADVAGTVAALLADAAGSGRSCLFLPGSRRTANALADTISALGLRDIFADLTREDWWQTGLADSLRAALARPEVPVDDEGISTLRQRLVQVRQELARYTDALHRQRSEYQVSVYEVLQALGVLTTKRPLPRTKVRFSPQVLQQLSGPGRQQALDVLQRAADNGALAVRAGTTPWYGAKLESADHAARVIAAANRLAGGALKMMREDAADVAQDTGLHVAETVGQWLEQLTMLDGVRDSLDVFVPLIFEKSAADMVIATHSKEWRREHSIAMKGSQRRRLVKHARDLVRPGRAVEDLNAELIKVQERREIWRRYAEGDGWPKLPSGLAELHTEAAGVKADLETLQGVVSPDGVSLFDIEMGRLEKHMLALADPTFTKDLASQTEIEREMDELGLSPLLTDLRERAVKPELVQAEFDLAWWASVLSVLLIGDADLLGLDGEALVGRMRALRHLDKEHVQTLPGPLLRAVVHRLNLEIEQDAEAANQLYRALAPEHAGQVAQVLATFPLARRLLPMWSVPALLTPQVVPDDAEIDLLIVEGSVPMAHAIALAARAAQVVVIGDARRPGGFGAAVSGLLPQLVLPTDRGDRDSEIATLLASHGYGEVIQPVPAPQRRSRIQVVRLDGRGLPSPGAETVESVEVEVQAVVDKVIEHALATSEQSLAVVALNASHAERVSAALQQAAGGSAALAAFLNAETTEHFVVSAVDDFTGLRRDHVIITVGFAKTPHGRVLHRFGTLAEPDGAAGLIDALDAVRERLTVVTCIGAEELSAARLYQPGPRLLRDLLAMAEQTPEPLSVPVIVTPTAPEAEDEADGEDEGTGQEEALRPDRLLVDLAERLFRLGLTVEPNYGTEGGVRIPLAIGHPQVPDQYIVAVLTDDAAYVAEPSQRRRDRHWVERLESRGWVVHTASAAAVFLNPGAQAERIKELVLESLRARRAEEERRRIPASSVALPHISHAGPVALPTAQSETEDAPAQQRADTEAPPEGGAAEKPAIQPEADSPASAPLPRGPRPPTAQGLPLAAYGDDQLDELLAWIKSDGVERSEDELLDELREALALRRRGAQVDAVLRHVVRRAAN